MIFDNKEANVMSFIDLVKFRVVWWFKNLGKGSSDPITLLLKDIWNMCVDSIASKDPKPTCIIIKLMFSTC